MRELGAWLQVATVAEATRAFAMIVSVLNLMSELVPTAQEGDVL
jgi:hypothetical protein